MRVLRLLGASVLLVIGVVSLNCSKKSTPPTAPAPPNPTCSLSATTLTFGTVTVGSSADRTFTLTNTGGGTLSGTVTESSSEFAIIGSATYSLGAGQVFTATLRFSPTSPGAKAVTVATGSTLCGSVTATGTGQSATPICFVSPTSINFGYVDYGNSPAGIPSYVTIRNDGGGTLSGSISEFSTDFSIKDVNGVSSPSFSLGPNQQATLIAGFTPTSGGTMACTLRVDPPSCSPVVLSGFGLLPVSTGSCSGGITVSSGDTLDFGEVSLGQTLERYVTIENNSTNTASNGSAYELCPEFEANFATNLLAGTSAQRPIRFTPTREGVQYCAVPFVCNLPSPRVQFYLICRGVGVGGNPACQVSASTIDFQQVPVGQTKDLTFQITNTGTGILAGTAGPSPCTEFTFVGPVNYTLRAGETATITVRYTPITIGHTTSCPLVPTGAGCAPLTLFGEAVAPPPVCEVTPSTLDFGIVAPGTTKDLSCTVRNVGGVGSNLCETFQSGSPAYFTIISATTYCLASGQSQVVTIRFSPDATLGSITTGAGGRWCGVALTGRTQ